MGGDRRFDVGARGLLASVVDQPCYGVEEPRPVRGSESLVEVGMVSAAAGTVFPCVNWADGPVLARACGLLPRALSDRVPRRGPGLGDLHALLQ